MRDPYLYRVVARIGEPFRLDEYRALYEADEQEAVRALTTEITRRLEAVTLNLTGAEDGDLIDRYLAANPSEAEALTSPYTVVRRQGDRLVAIPYSVEYREWLEPAARLLEQAAAITSNASLKRFLSLRAQSFRTDDYFQSELAWMDLAGTPIEVAIGLQPLAARRRLLGREVVEQAGDLVPDGRALLGRDLPGPAEVDEGGSGLGFVLHGASVMKGRAHALWRNVILPRERS